MFCRDRAGGGAEGALAPPTFERLKLKINKENKTVKNKQKHFISSLRIKVKIVIGK